jgi:hypothetical protein
MSLTVTSQGMTRRAYFLRFLLTTTSLRTPNPRHPNQPLVRLSVPLPNEVV